MQMEHVWLRMVLAFGLLLIAVFSAGIWLTRSLLADSARRALEHTPEPDSGSKAGTQRIRQRGAGKAAAAAEQSAAILKRDLHGSPWRTLLLWQALLFIPAAVFLAVALLGGTSAPLGVPLPAVPQLVQIKDVTFENASLAQHRVPKDALEYLAPQPDGFPPLRYTYHCEYVEFSIQHPMGAETTAFGADTVVKDNVLAVVDFKLDYPLTRITYSAPLHGEQEKLTEYVARCRAELSRAGAQFYAGNEPLLLANYRFEHFEYQQKDEAGQATSHFVYFGPYGNRALTIDFQTTPEQHERARSLVDKIMHSFAAQGRVLDMMHREWPDYVAPPEESSPGASS